ncbi:hypothetical protein V5O48_005131 [Marasmius crinis-equi]|uniref:F-box domain-containing protein n=1 Tax=Marasmius crinis-equi TaxID=585013 RepID=A0ABR3FN36_9AGAR
MFYNVPNILQLYVERSKTLPLTISFASDSNTDLTGRILRTMLNCRSRWRNITLDVSSKAVDGTISRSLTDIPLLESLGINISFLKFIRPTRVDITLFQNAPCLKTVSLFGASAFTHREAVHFHAALPGGGALPGWPFAALAPPAIVAPAPPPFAFGIAGPLVNPALTLPASIPAVPSPRDISPRLPLPWKQLSTLDIEFAAYGDFFPVLAQTPNVVTCHLKSEISTRTNPHDVITLPKLRSLRLSGTAVYVLQGLLAPGLKSLVIENTEQPGSGREERFILPFIQASSCALQHLSFQSIPMTEHVLGILRGMPTLSGLNLDLYLKHPRDSAQFGALISALTYVNLQEILLPKLKDLSLSVYSKSGLPTRALVDMVKSRRKVSVAMDEQNARLEHLYLIANCGWSPPFDELKEDRGLKTDLVLR